MSTTFVLGVLLHLASLKLSRVAGLRGVVRKSDFNENPVVSLDLDYDFGLRLRVYQFCFWWKLQMLLNPLLGWKLIHWWKYITPMKINHCYENSLLWNLITLMEIHECCQNKSLGWKYGFLNIFNFENWTIQLLDVAYVANLSTRFTVEISFVRK